MINKKIVIASRKSNLAKVQLELVVMKLQHAGYKNIEKVFLQSEGDQVSKINFKKEGGKGLFTRKIDKLIINNKVDIGIHSAKDIPADLDKRICIGAYLKREDIRDVLITKDFNISNIKQIPKNSTLGTSSPRRAAYINYIRPDLKIVDIRGNIETRIAKVIKEKVFAIILAKAGLNRLKSLKKNLNFSTISLNQILPSPGQGAIAVVDINKSASIKSSVILGQKSAENLLKKLDKVKCSEKKI